ncbi:cyclase family protein [Hyphomonas oceanitis]|uniref:Polyketide cyclase n=1 Tax=Hyphomonas oceanitis SCH89 TaxID=1280953 RepID=A0A059G559_9PROT|nr:cyclase family protein [Hyphomonas oceanitis]KDA01854.1 polyketide cyclase [Hyphomonas oceanitis SCH89]
MRLIDITRPLDPEDINKLPEAMRASASTFVPEIIYQRPAHEGADVMCQLFDCCQGDLPGGEGWGAERLHINTHLGTHVDAPLHYGSTCEGKPSRTISDIDINELHADGHVLDLRGKVEKRQGIPVELLRAEIEAHPVKIGRGDAIMLRTGQEDHPIGDMNFFNYPGMTREGTLYLASLGAKILGTDALGWDRPFDVMRKAFKETGDKSQIWDGHFAGRDAEVFIIQQLHNLKSLPPHGFKVGFFPLHLARCSASPARAVAFVS